MLIEGNTRELVNIGFDSWFRQAQPTDAFPLPEPVEGNTIKL